MVVSIHFGDIWNNICCVDFSNDGYGVGDYGNVKLLTFSSSYHEKRHSHSTFACE